VLIFDQVMDGTASEVDAVLVREVLGLILTAGIAFMAAPFVSKLPRWIVQESVLVDGPLHFPLLRCSRVQNG
jgi:hypothetical protein